MLLYWSVQAPLFILFLLLFLLCLLSLLPYFSYSYEFNVYLTNFPFIYVHTSKYRNKKKYILSRVCLKEIKGLYPKSYSLPKCSQISL